MLGFKWKTIFKKEQKAYATSSVEIRLKSKIKN